MAYKIVGLQLAGTVNGGPPVIRQMRITTSTVPVYEGTPLTMSGGYLAAATVASSTIYGVLGCTLAAADTGSATKSYPVYLATNENIFEAVANGSTTPLSTIGGYAQIAVATTGDFYITTASSAPSNGSYAAVVGTLVDPKSISTAATGVHYLIRYLQSAVEL